MSLSTANIVCLFRKLSSVCLWWQYCFTQFVKNFHHLKSDQSYSVGFSSFLSSLCLFAKPLYLKKCVFAFLVQISVTPHFVAVPCQTKLCKGQAVIIISLSWHSFSFFFLPSHSWWLSNKFILILNHCVACNMLSHCHYAVAGHQVWITHLCGSLFANQVC